MAKRVIREIKSVVLIILGILSAGMGIKGYLLSSHFIDGGVTGVSMLLNNIFGISLSVLLPLINLPFIILAYYQMGPRFAVKSTLAIAGLAVCLAIMPYPDVTPDKLLTAVFGGFFIGLGIGLAIRGEAVLDGTEIAAVLVNRSNSFLKVSDMILVLNVIIFATAAFFLGVEPASYSILTYFAATKTIDFLLHGLEEYTGITVISKKNTEIRAAIVERMERGVTMYRGAGGNGTHGAYNPEHDILFTVVTRLEVGKVQTLIQGIDPEAVVIQQSINEMKGGMIKRRPLH